MSPRQAALALLALFAPLTAAPTDSASEHYRLIGSAPASVSAVTGTPAYSLYVVGGSGDAAGISASASTSVVAGGASNRLPTDRMFADGFD